MIVTTRPTKDEAAIRETVETFWNALGKNGEKACQQLSGDAQARFTRHAHDTSCVHAAKNADPVHQRVFVSPPADIYDFGAADFGPDHKWARVPSKFESGGEKFAVVFFPSIELEQGDGHWVIDSLNWYFEY